MSNKFDRFPVLETNRLILRKIEQDDAHDIFEYLSDKEVMKHYGTEPFQTVDEAYKTISKYEAVFAEKRGIRWGITLKEEDKVIGSCFFYDMNWDHYRTDLGYILNKDYWKRGIAQEAVKAIIQYGIENLNINRFQSVIDPPNVPSQKVVERLGFQREGLLRSYEYFSGKFDDLYMYSLLKSDVEK
ncbi:GNAT family N-acetyltransferase [Ornithinibacillus halotolerans]|uniref:N-acetyltransferase YoaA n=1 Tax=Ornithinibacillus halotolerans TaxID=1274357 RepID=A0A916RL04_9BACI|nr:GNAT family N-acetyltransferase [Ornithinibacillus halotolerans]GGA60072.1 putative N-acetyltransferase YoaA [Ornithinibacillus halotolerans]